MFGGGKKATRSCGIVQADSINNSIILQMIGQVQEPEDLDAAITKTGAHLAQIRRQKGWQDVRIPLTVMGSICIFIGLHIGWPFSLLLYICSALMITGGYKLNSRINLLDSQIVATQGLLSEFYRLKLHQQLTSK